ncbi:hypothetical protein, conserved [Eimeria maxima]|uniref:Uncharacterized protein n=1 Tax=Eimeria maxima TaxID=5804 RepID=U6LY40_EIMMA|nr:hypothetical protein, conserved [Eimeria maxima]CDJ56882.1 hypothetical protein, conserved [Eimeria maxima]
MAAAAPGGDAPLPVHPSTKLPVAVVGDSAAAENECRRPLPVFASGDPQLEQRLLQTFAALRMPEEHPSPSTVAAASGPAGGEDVEHPGSPVAAVVPGEGPPATGQTEAGSADASAMVVTQGEALTARGAPAATTTTQVAGTVASSSSSSVQADSAVLSEQPAGRASTEGATTAGGEAGAVEAAAPAASVGTQASASAATTRGRRVGEEQEIALPRRPATARGESPGACSEATDSTHCTETFEGVRPPPFGNWRYYSLADVPDEAMSVAAMRRACQQMLQQLRRVAAATEAGTGASLSALDPAASAARPVAGSPAASTETAATAEEEPEDPRVHLGPRRRAPRSHTTGAA